MQAVKALDEAIEALAGESVFVLDDAELGELLVAFHRFRSQLAAHEARFTAAFDRCGFKVDGSRSTTAWLMRNCRLSRRVAYAQVRMARRLRTMPVTQAALATGDITVEQAERLARLAHSHRKLVRDAFPEAEQTLVDQAGELLHADFERVLGYWEDLIDPDGTQTTAEDDYDARELFASELLRGVVKIDGTMDPIGGAIFLRELMKIERAMFDADWQAARTEHGDDTKTEHLCRSAPQRRADALQEMARRSANSDVALDRDGLPAPLVVVHVGPDVITNMCELASGTVIAPGLLIPHLGEADIERIVYDTTNRVIELGKRDRFFRGGLRRALELKYRRCQHPGCDEPAEHSDIDHIKPHSHGGHTTQDNGIPRCGGHNRWAYNHTQRHGHHNDHNPIPPTGPDPPDTG